MRARILMLAGCAAMLSACVQETTTPASEGEIDHGRYLVTQVAGCNDCHTPPLANGEPDMTRSLQGSPLAFAPIPQIPWASTAPPIAGGPSGYNDEQFVHFL